MKNLGDELIEGMENALAYLKGKKSRAVVHCYRKKSKSYQTKNIDRKKTIKQRAAAGRPYKQRLSSYWLIRWCGTT